MISIKLIAMILAGISIMLLCFAAGVLFSAHREVSRRIEQRKPPRYQWREIGEGDWRDCTREQYEYAQSSPILDTRIGMEASGGRKP